MKVLITGANWWHNSARLALAFGAKGAEVAVCYPDGSPALKARTVSARYRYRELEPLGSLTEAIAASRPDLIVPTDDQTVVALHELWEQGKGQGPEAAARVEVIERSLGLPSGHATIDSRGDIMDLAREEQIRAPQGRRIATDADLDDWCDGHEFPWVLKNDLSCSGSGVRIVRSLAEARRARRFLAAYPTLARAARHLLVNRNRFTLHAWSKGKRPILTVQDYIPGAPANATVACWQGEVLAMFSVVVCTSSHDTGPASVVRVIEHPEMTQAAMRLVRRLGMSGFCGLDFVIESRTGHAYFLELNPRATQLCHLPLGPGRDLVAALFRSASGAEMPDAPIAATSDEIAIFPNAQAQDPECEAIRSGYHDVPWEDPDLVKELLRPTWTDRGAMHVMIQRARKLFTRHAKSGRGVETNWRLAVQEAHYRPSNLRQLANLNGRKAGT